MPDELLEELEELDELVEDLPELEELDELDELEELDELDDVLPELEELELELDELPVWFVPEQAVRAMLTSPTPISDREPEDSLNSFMFACPAFFSYLNSSDAE